MIKRTKIFQDFSLVVLIVLLINLIGCGKVNEVVDPVDRIVFGFAQLGDESEFRTSSSADIKRAALEADVQLLFENAQQKQANQIKAIRSFILNKVDVIAFCPIVEEGWDNVLLEAKEANIPVILVDRYIKTEEEGLYCAFIGSNFKEEGRKAGRWIKERFKDTEDIVRVAEISGTENSSPTIGRHAGLIEVFGNDSKFKIVASENGDFMRSRGRECMEEILRKTPDIDILYVHNDDMALGAIEIMEEQGIKPGKDIVIVSIDAQKSGLEALEAGKINCLVECSPYIGDELMSLVLKVSNGEDVPGITYTKEEVFTEDTDFDTLPVRP